MTLAYRPDSQDNFSTALRSGVSAAVDWLIADQKPDGHWVGRAESNSCMEAQWRLALWFLGLDDHPLCARLAQSLLDTQRPDGAWEIYHGAPNGDINTTVEAYAALRCSGFCRRPSRLLKAPVLDRGQGRVEKHSRLHPLLAGPDRRMAVGKDAKPAAGGVSGCRCGSH